MPYTIKHEQLPNGTRNHVVKFNGEVIGETTFGAVVWRIMERHKAERKKQIEHELREAWTDSTRSARGASVSFNQWVKSHTGMYATLCKEYLE